MQNGHPYLASSVDEGWRCGVRIFWTTDVDGATGTPPFIRAAFPVLLTLEDRKHVGEGPTLGSVLRPSVASCSVRVATGGSKLKLGDTNPREMIDLLFRPGAGAFEALSRPVQYQINERVERPIIFAVPMSTCWYLTGVVAPNRRKAKRKLAERKTAGVRRSSVLGVGKSLASG